MATTIKISGMTCGHCVMAVKLALQDMPDVTVLDVKVGEAVIDGAVDMDKAKALIEDEGYQVVSVS